MISLYILGAILIILLVGVILAPLLEREPPDRDLEDLPPDERYEATLEALRELEFDYRTDKLSEEEYRRLRSHYGRLALEAEEEMEGEPGGESVAAAAAAGGGASPGGEGSRPGAGGADGAPSPAAGDGGGQGSGAGESRRECAGCGGTVPAGARFCPRCGEEQVES